MPLPPPPPTPQAEVKNKELDCLIQLQGLCVMFSSASLLFTLFSSTYWLSSSGWCQSGCCIPAITAKQLWGEAAHSILGELPQEPPLSSDWPALPTAQPTAGQRMGPPGSEAGERWALGSVQFSSVAQSCPTLCDPMNRSTPGLPVHHQLPEFTQTHVHSVGDAIQPSHPLSSPSPPAPNPS